MSIKAKFLAKASKIQLGVCPISGISVQIEVPHIVGKTYTYPHPLSIVVNAIGIAKLSYKEKASLGNELLAGATLSLLSHYQLIQDKLSSVERNFLLQQCSTYQLHSLLHAIVSASKATIANWPHIAFSQSIAHSTPANQIQDYISIITGAYTSDSTTSYTSISTTQKQKKQKQKSVSKELRAHINSLISDILPLISAKVIQVLKITAQGNNLYNLNPSLRSKLVAKLQEIDSLQALTLADIIANAATEEVEEVSSSFVEDRPRKSLLEILASKTSVVKIEEKQEEEKQEVIETVEDLFYPTFKRDNCDECEYEMSSCKTLGYCYTYQQRLEESTASILGTIKEVVDELGIENNLEYIEDEDEDEEDEFEAEEDHIADFVEIEDEDELGEGDSETEEEGDDDEF